jgi:hypothetical protein
MVKICQTVLLKLNFETRPKKRIFRICQKFPQAMDEVEIFFCQFPNPWVLRVSGMGCYTSKCEKSQNHCTLLYKTVGDFFRWAIFSDIDLRERRGIKVYT